MSTQSATQTTQPKAQGQTRRRRGAPRKDLYQSPCRKMRAQGAAIQGLTFCSYGARRLRPPAPRLIG